jgi:hypothetical protein
MNKKRATLVEIVAIGVISYSSAESAEQKVCNPACPVTNDVERNTTPVKTEKKLTTLEIKVGTSPIKVDTSH